MTEQLGTGTTSTPAVKGLNTGTDPDQGRGVWGESDEHDGVAGYSSASDRFSGYFKNLSDGWGLYAETSGPARISLWGYASGDSSHGLYGKAYDVSSYGVGAASSASYALYVDGTTHVTGPLLGFAGTTGIVASFTGNVDVYGDLDVDGTTKAFVMDHPLDPANRILKHACVEAPERRNIYDGIAVAGADGTATVLLPAYFEKINTSFCYQLTAIGEAAPELHLRDEVQLGQFVIAGAKPQQEISWQITGRLNDPASMQRPFVAESEKDGERKGRYFAPEAFGQPASAGIRQLRARPVPPQPNRPRDPR